MSQIRTAIIAGALLTALSLSGCGDDNSRSVFHAESGKHPSGWVDKHSASAKADLETCIDCHGENLDGGISKVACTNCHLGNGLAIHPEQWGQYAYARHKSYVELNGTATCANAACHGPTLAGVAGSGDSCATACHMGGIFAKHPAVWTQFSSHGNYVKANSLTGCSTAACHGIDSRGVFLSGPSCYLCHTYAPDSKHPPTWVDITSHKDYVNLNGSSTCLTSICHGTGGTGPACANCHN